MTFLRSAAVYRVACACGLFAALAMIPALAEDPVVKEWKYQPELLVPFWQGEVMQGESVLFIKESATGEARGSLLFPPLKVLKVQTSAGDVTYEEGRDYTWKPDSREIVLPAGSRIVSKTPADLRRPAKTQKYNLTHRDGNGEIFFGSELEYHGMQTCVTYSHAPDLWKLPVPKVAEKDLGHSIRKLRDKQPLSILLLGDSISSGCNASGWAKGAPFQPPFQNLLQQHLEAQYNTKVALKNPSLGGSDTRWALTMSDKVIEEKPDLVILAFGMNDSSGRPAAEYASNLDNLMQKIRQDLPECEFILIAPMLGNKDWITLKQELFPQYRDALAKLAESDGVALADMTSIWTEFFKHKQDWDLTGNGVNHPNDFGHRVYAQVLSALLTSP